jgi:hypothetical protein
MDKKGKLLYLDNKTVTMSEFVLPETARKIKGKSGNCTVYHLILYGTTEIKRIHS